MAETAADVRAGLLREIEAENVAKGRSPKPAPAKLTEPTVRVTRAQAAEFYAQARAEERAAQETAAAQARLARALDAEVAAIPHGYDPDELLNGFRTVAGVSPSHAKAYLEQLRLHHPDVAAYAQAEIELSNALELDRIQQEQAQAEAERQAHAEAQALADAANRWGVSADRLDEATLWTNGDVEAAGRVAAGVEAAERVAAFKSRMLLDDHIHAVRPRFDAHGRRLEEPPKVDPAGPIVKALERSEAMERGELTRSTRSADELKAAILAPTDADREMRSALGRPAHTASPDRVREDDGGNTGPRLIS